MAVNETPLWYRLDEKSQMVLRWYQRRYHHKRLSILDKPPLSAEVTVSGHIEPAEEIEKLMAQAPSRSRGGVED